MLFVILFTAYEFAAADLSLFMFLMKNGYWNINIFDKYFLQAVKIPMTILSPSDTANRNGIICLIKNYK